MTYPFWDVGVGYGVLMATVAILHVFVSHFAIGGGLYLVVAERSARRSGSSERLAYLQQLTKFFVLVTLVFGALSGVGIWFIIGLLNPAATEALIHNFVWGWAIEWTFFVVEIAAAILYFYGWKVMKPTAHMIVGWIYFAAAWLSLVVINGIVTFMLTPGRWLETGAFWDGFFNPTNWSSLVLRTGICLLLAGTYAMLVASRQRNRDLRASLVRYNAAWSLAGVLVIIPSGFWYWHAIPDRITEAASGMMRIPITSLEISMWVFAVLALATLFFGLAVPRRLHTGVAIGLMALALVFFGGYEWMRESIRKPYVIYDYMYGNAVELADVDVYIKEGYLPGIAFRTGDDGADLLRHACRHCHTIDGYNGLAATFDGTDPEFIAGMIRGVESIKGNMPPFHGTDEEADLIAATLWDELDQRPFTEIHGLSGAALGEKVFAVRCGRCHEPGGFQDNYDSLVDLDRADYEDILDNGGDYGEGMPDFSGSLEERTALIAWLLALEPGGATK